MNKPTKIVLLLILALGWMFCIFKLSGMTSKNSNGKSADIISMFIEDALDLTNDYGITNSHPTDEKIAKAAQLMNSPLRKVIHATVYFVLAFFLMILLNIIFDHKKYALSFAIALIIAVLFAISDEYHQTLVHGRTGQILDVCIDSAGAIMGLALYSTYHIVYRNGYRQALKDRENKE